MFVLIFSLNSADSKTKVPFDKKCFHNKLSNAVIKDVKESFKNELQVLEEVHEVEYTDEDLQKAYLAVGKEDPHLNSLFNYFAGGSNGERRLYLYGKDGIFGFLLYKKEDGTNVLTKLRLSEKEWVKEYQKEKNGVIFKYKDYCGVVRFKKEKFRNPVL